MSLLTAMPNAERAALKAANDPKGALMDIRIATDDIRRRIRAGEASNTDVFCALNAIMMMAGGV